MRISDWSSDVCSSDLVYKRSRREFDGVLRSPDYPDCAEVRRVRSNGMIKWKGGGGFLSEVLLGEPVGLFQRSDTIWIVKYGPRSDERRVGKEGVSTCGSGGGRYPQKRQNQQNK